MPKKATSDKKDSKSGKYYFTQDSVEQYASIAEGYDGSELIAELRKHLPDGSSVLEIGMGPGTDLEILLNFYTATGSDISPLFVERYRKQRPGADLMVLDAVSLKTNRTFDSLYSNKVLQHLTDDELVQSVLRQTQILNEDGIICHSFWKGDEDYEQDGLIHNFHTQSGIEDVFTKSFQVLHLETYKEMESGDSILLVGRRR